MEEYDMQDREPLISEFKRGEINCGCQPRPKLEY